MPLGDCSQFLCLFFFHPDYTVGFGISPNQPVGNPQKARGLAGLCRITAGVDLHHPLKNAIKFFLLYHSLHDL
jgi:hypothetical protein